MAELVVRHPADAGRRSARARSTSRPSSRSARRLPRGIGIAVSHVGAELHVQRSCDSSLTRRSVVKPRAGAAVQRPACPQTAAAMSRTVSKSNVKKLLNRFGLPLPEIWSKYWRIVSRDATCRPGSRPALVRAAPGVAAARSRTQSGCSPSSAPRRSSGASFRRTRSCRRSCACSISIFM